MRSHWMQGLLACPECGCLIRGITSSYRPNLLISNKKGLLTFVWALQRVFKIMLNYQASYDLSATFLACPKKGGAKEGHPATNLIRHARSYSVHFRNSPFEQVKHYGLGQSEMFNPRTRSHDGSVRMGKPFKQYPKTRMSPERPYEIVGHPSWPKDASRRAARTV